MSPSQWIEGRKPDAEAHGALPTVVEGSAPEALPVAMTILADGARTAEERGWLGLADGWLVFEGLRATVSLRPDSVERVQYEPDATRFGLTDGRDVELRLIVDPVQTTLPARRSQRNGVAETVRAWQATKPPEGDAVYPPRASHPEVAGERVGRPLIGVVACEIPAAFLAVASVPPWAALFGLGGLGFLVAFLLRLLAFRRALPTLMAPPSVEKAAPSL